MLVPAVIGSSFITRLILLSDCHLSWKFAIHESSFGGVLGWDLCIGESLLEKRLQGCHIYIWTVLVAGLATTRCTFL